MAPGESWGSKQAHRVIHYPISVVSQCSLVPGCRAGLRRSAPTYGKRKSITGTAWRCAIQIYFTYKS